MPSKEEYWKDPEKHRAKTRAYAVAHPEWKRASGREWARKKRSEDPQRHRDASNNYRKKNQAKRQAATLAWVRRRPGYYLLKNAQARAKKLGLAFNLTLDDIQIPTVCPVLGIPIEATVRGRRGFHPNSPSIDRIIPDLGYVRGNICIISMRANWIKRDGSADELIRIANWLNRESARVCAELAG